MSIPIALPKGTVEWYYTFTATRNKDEVAQTKNGMKLFGTLSKMIDASGLTGIVVDQLAAPPGGDVCDVFLLDDQNSTLFVQKVDFKLYRDWSRENLKQRTIRMSNPWQPNYLIGIKNPSAGYGIHVTLEAVAIVLEEVWENREVIKYDVSTRQEPYLANNR